MYKIFILFFERALLIENGKHEATTMVTHSFKTWKEEEQEKNYSTDLY